jgi:proteasome accessory factor C
VAEHRTVHLDYYSYGRDARTERDVDPYEVHVTDGSLYLLGYCHLAEADRRFRVDRIGSAELLDQHFAPPAAAPPAAVFEPDADDPRVVLDLTADGAWVAEVHPVESREDLADGGVRVRLAVAAEAWFERLLLTLGSQATVVEAPPGLADARRRASARILDRYR